MKQLSITLLLLAFALRSHSQVYKVAEPISSPITHYEGSLTLEKNVDGTLFYNRFNSIYQYKNGVLSTLPDVPINLGFDSSYISDIEIFDNKIFVAGVFDDFNSGTTNYGLIYLDAGKWVGVSSTKNIKISRLANAGNYLYGITATYAYKQSFSNYGTFVTNTGVVKIDKSLAFSNVISGKVDNLTTFNTDEMVFTKYPINKVYRYNGSNFDTLAISFTADSSVFSSANSGDTTVYFRSKKYIFAIDKAFKLKLIDSSSTKQYYFPGVKGVYDGALYFDDRGMLQRQYFDLKKNNFQNLYGLNDSLGTNFYEAGNDMMNYGKFYTITHPDIKYLASEVDDGVLVYGSIFEDLNQNCVKDKGEKINQKVKVEFESGGKYFMNFSNDTGYYQIVIPAGTYKLNLKNKHLKNTYDSCGGNNKFTAAKKYQADIPFRIQAGIKDISGNITGGTGFLARRGATEQYFLSYTNLGSTTENITLKLEYPDSLTFNSSSVTPTSHSSRVLTFVFNSVPKFGSGTIKLQFEIHSKKQLNSTISFVCNTLTKTNDVDSTDNTDTLNQRIVAAIDPNTKQSYPEGIVTKPINKILYHIQFQNEGNYFARKVTVVDTFDSKLPLTKVKMTGSKHPYTLRVDKGNVIVWEFDNINLAPKSDGDEISQGYISFEATLNSPLGINEKILNRAHIYFDYEDPLPTPYAIVSAGKEFGSVKSVVSNNERITIFPNPAQEYLTITKSGNIGTIYVYDVSGRLMVSKTIQNTLDSIDISNWAKGVYSIHFESFGMNMKFIKL
jgi:hypothetical protein